MQVTCQSEPSAVRPIDGGYGAGVPSLAGRSGTTPDRRLLGRGFVSDFWHQHGFDWMAGLTERETEQVLSRITPKEFARGEIVFGPTSSARSVYLLEKGLVRIVRLSPEGAQVTLGYVRPGEVFGELQAISDQARESFAQAISPLLVWRMPIPELRRLIATIPHFGLHVAEQMAKRFKRVERRVEGLALHDLRTRICLILLELAEDFGREAGSELLIDFPLSQRDLATLVGASRQSVNACLRGLRDAQQIAYRGRRIALLDPAELRRQADRTTGASR